MRDVRVAVGLQERPHATTSINMSTNLSMRHSLLQQHTDRFQSFEQGLFGPLSGDGELFHRSPEAGPGGSVLGTISAVFPFKVAAMLFDNSADRRLQWPT